MIELQVINKVIGEGDLQAFLDNGINNNHFPYYKKEFNYILEYYNKYKQVPSPETFLTKFPEFKSFVVRESATELIDNLKEEKNFDTGVGILEKGASIMKDNPTEGLQWIKTQLNNLSFENSYKGEDIVAAASKRYENYLNREVSNDFIQSGFKELDELIGGYHKGEELVVIFARTGEGKSFYLIKTLQEVWSQGYNVGLITPEMTAERVGYRFDSSLTHLSNQGLLRGDKIEQGEYKEHINSLHGKSGFRVIRRDEFPYKDVTVSKIRDWITQNNIEVLGVDGISYIRDERANKNDNKTTQLEHISNDLMELSIELGIPILVVVQANRTGIINKSLDKYILSLGAIRDSDAISHNASKVLSLIYEDTVSYIGIAKNRDGIKNTVLKYSWNPDRAKYIYIPDNDNITNNEQQKEELKNKFANEKILF